MIVFLHLSSLHQGIGRDYEDAGIEYETVLETFVCDVAMALLGKEIEIKEEKEEPVIDVMNEDDLWWALSRMYLYDTGCADGIDEPLRKKVKKQISNMSNIEWRLFISRNVREKYLSDNALADSYGLANVADFCRWLEDDIECGV